MVGNPSIDNQHLRHTTCSKAFEKSSGSEGFVTVSFQCSERFSAILFSALITRYSYYGDPWEINSTTITKFFLDSSDEKLAHKTEIFFWAIPNKRNEIKFSFSDLRNLNS